jgi:hypothetical protein
MVGPSFMWVASRGPGRVTALHPLETVIEWLWYRALWKFALVYGEYVRRLRVPFWLCSCGSGGSTPWLLGPAFALSVRQ